MAAGSDIPFYVYFERELPEGGVAFSDNPPEVFGSAFAKPVAVDASGTPLAVQPLMEWDTDHGEFTVFDSSGAPTSFDPPYYQFPNQYWVHIEVGTTPGTDTTTYHPIAVDQFGTPLPTQPLIELDPADPTDLNKAYLHDTSGNLQPWPWEIPKDYSVHIAVSGSPGTGAPSYEPVAVDSAGTPLTIQPNMQLNPTDPTKVTILDARGLPISYQPPIYQIPHEYQVHIEVSGTPGRSAATYTPVAVDKSGTPLAIQPVMEVDPANPSKVTIYDSTGAPTDYRPPIYEIPNDYQVHLATVGLPGHGTLTHYPIAVDSSGTPLTIQPKLELDPIDPTKITVYGLDGEPTSYEPDIYDFPERFTVHLGVSGPPGQGVPTYEPVAVDEFGTPLAVQPLMKVDPADPTNITVYDHAGTPTGFQPPIHFDKLLAPYKIDDEADALAETDVDEQESATAADDATVSEPDPEAHLDEASSTAPEAGAAPAPDAAPIADAVASDDHDAGAGQTQGQAEQDSGSTDDLITAGLDEPADPGTPTRPSLEPDEADIEATEPGAAGTVEAADNEAAPTESLITAGLDESSPETGAVDIDVEPMDAERWSETEQPAASPDLIPENDRTTAEADEARAIDLDEVSVLPIPIQESTPVADAPDHGGTVVAETIEETGFVEMEATPEATPTEVEEATITPIEVRIQVPDAELERTPAEIEETAERVGTVEDEIDDAEGRLEP